jgi:hypothetical protein
MKQTANAAAGADLIRRCGDVIWFFNREIFELL